MPVNSFDYSGHLVFSVFITHSKQKEPTRSNFITGLLQQLPKYTEGDPDSPGDGYSKIRLDNQAQFESELPEWVLENFGRWNYIQYSWEEYDQREAFVNGERQEVQIPSVETVDMFFHPSGLTLLRGKSSAILQATSRIQKKADGELLFDRVKIDLENIIEIFGSGNNLLNTNLYLKRTRKAEFLPRNASTERLSVKGEDIFSSDVVQKASRSGQLVSLNGDFQFVNFSLSANIKTDKIFIRASRDIKNLPPASRLILSIIFCFQILKHQNRIREEVF